HEKQCDRLHAGAGNNDGARLNRALPQSLAAQIANAIDAVFRTKSDFAHHGVVHDGQFVVQGGGSEMNVGGIVFRDDIAARHAVAAVVAGGSAGLASRQRCLADVNYLNAQAGRAALDDPVRAAHRHGRQKDTVGEIFQVICISANTDLSLDLVVVGRKIGVIQGPIFSRPFECVALEIPV